MEVSVTLEAFETTDTRFAGEGFGQGIRTSAQENSSARFVPVWPRPDCGLRAYNVETRSQRFLEARVRVRVRVCPGYDVKLYPSQIIGTNLSRIARRHFGVAVPGDQLAQACSEHKYHS